MLSPRLKLRRAKQLMNFAAEIAVQCMLTTDIDNAPAQLILARLAARAIRRNARWLAGRTIRAPSEAAVAIESQEGQVAPARPEIFRSWTERVHMRRNGMLQLSNLISLRPSGKKKSWKGS